MTHTKRHIKQKGNAIVEFALGWSVLWLLFAGIYQYGYAFYVYNVLQTSVANAAQIGSKLSYDTGSPSTFTTAVQNMVLYGDTTAGTKTITPGLTASNVNINVNPEDSMPTDITITINNFNIDTIFWTWSLTGKPRVTTVYLGQITCSTC